MEESFLHKFTVKGVNAPHREKARVLVHYCRRGGAKRHDIVKITAPTGRFAYASVIGRDVDDGEIGLDFDQRVKLGVNLDEKVELEVRRVGLLGRLVWYLNVAPPLMRLSAWLGLISVVLGLLSLILAVF